MSDECSNEDKTPGIFSWRELVTQDLDGSRKFYTELLGWTEDSMEMPGGMEYISFMNGETPVGGVVKPPAEKGDVPTTWINYITVEDLDATVAKAQELGAHLCMPITEIPGKGRFAGVADPQGAPIAFWQFL
jgi:predicted enzyme related to lactoylglutathione lyase